MLNIGKLAPDGERYYLATVASTVHDYYTGKGEAPGRWLGSSSDRLGLTGVVDPAALRAVLGARHPTDETPLGPGRGRSVPGFDLTFRAPKSVSLLWALSDTTTSAQVRDAHDTAVAAAIGYLERQAARTRRGHGGAEHVAAEGFVAASFRHRVSRADDPLLHTHVLVANLAHTTDDGTWRSLDARHLYTHAKTAGYLYQAQLRAELTRRLGVRFARVHHGTADIIGVPRSVIEAFSRRRAEVRAELDRTGHRSARAAQVATLATRRAKSSPGERAGLRPRWQQRATTLGFGKREVVALTGPALDPDLPGEQVADVRDHLIGEHGLTAQGSTFDRRDTLQGWCDQLPAGADVDTVERLADALLADASTLARTAMTVDGTATGPVIRLQGGHTAPAGHTGPRFTTPELLALETWLVESALAARTSGVGEVPESLLASAMARHPTLTTEQTDAVRALTSDGAGVAVLVGRAGTGKTFTLGAARQAWQSAGTPVIGCALAARAARELAEGSGIAATTIHRLLTDLDHPVHGGLSTGAVLVVDEAAMVGTRTLARLAHHCRAADAKLVLVGDHHQLPEIAAGGTFGHLARRLPGIELTVNRRQLAAWERETLDELRHGDLDAAVDAYADADRIVTARDAEHLREQLVDDWWQAAAEQGHDAVMVAARRDDIDDLNRRARTRMASRGQLSGPVVEVAGRPVQVGDRILCLRNHYSVGVLNGTRGTVIEIDPRDRTLTFVRDDTGGAIELTPAYLDAGWIDHGYALTAHKAQGLTCESTFVLADDAIHREWGYVALSRGRQTNRLYVTTEPDPDPPDDPTHPERHQPDTRDDLERLTANLRRRQQQMLALDHLPAASADDHDTRVGSSRRPLEAAQEVPPGLTRALGSRPDDAELARRWDQARDLVVAYRAAQGIEDTDVVLGVRPDDPTQHLAHQEALEALVATRRALRWAPAPAVTQARDLDLTPR